MSTCDTSSANPPTIQYVRAPRHDRGGDDEAADQEPQHARCTGNWLSELCQLGIAESLGKPHQVNEAVHGEQADERCKHGSPWGVRAWMSAQRRVVAESARQTQR